LAVAKDGLVADMLRRRSIVIERRVSDLCGSETIRTDGLITYSCIDGTITIDCLVADYGGARTIGTDDLVANLITTLCYGDRCTQGEQAYRYYE